MARKYGDLIKPLPQYGDLIKTLPMMKREGMPAMFAAGAQEMNGFGVHIIYAFSFANGLTGRSTKPHVHDNFDEAIFCLGSDPNDVSDLGATIEVAIGAEGEQERYSFDKPSVIVVPKGIFHTPMLTHDYRKPVLVMAVSLTDKYEARYE